MDLDFALRTLDLGLRCGGASFSDITHQTLKPKVAGDTASISGVTLTLALNGAISNSGNLTVTNSIFSSNTDGNGGAISNSLSLTVNNCTFTNNTATSGSATGLGGGAIYSSGASAIVMISDSTFTGNAETGGSGGGGAIRNRGGTINITNSTFSSNTALDGGGAIQNSDIMGISGSTFTGNSTSTSNGNGGGISNRGGLTITNTLITGNSAAVNGGGIYYQPNALTGTSLTVINSTISNNTANSDSNTTGDGGGLFLTGTGSVTISGSTITGNRVNGSGTSAAGDGGGINVASVPLTLTNSTVSGNIAGRNGGGIYATGGSTDVLNIKSSTIVNNTAAGDGGGVVRASSSNPLNFHNTIVANNTDDGTGPDIFGAVNSNGYNLIENTTGATITGDTATNITGLDPNLSALQNNGGPTFTHALLSPSPAIDKGSSGDLNTDQRGSSRPVDDPLIPNATGGNGADIGAFEVQQFSATTYEGIEASVTGMYRAELVRAFILLTEYRAHFGL